MKNLYDVIIIGAGPSGMSAALYLKRAGINVVILEKSSPGGALNKTSKIENYPGYTDEEGTTLAFRMYDQIKQLTIDIKIENVIEIIKEDNFIVKTVSNEYISKYILITTGKVPRKLSALNSEKYEGNGISYCSICDGALYKNKDVAIIGGGNSAMEAVRYMKGIANKIYLINRSSELRATKKEQEVLKSEKVEVIYNNEVKEILEQEGVLSGLKLYDEKILKVSGVFVCIGQQPNEKHYQKLNLKKDSKGIIVNKKMQTSFPNVYAAGDSISKDLYQVVTAVSEGALAANDIVQKIEKHTN